MSKVALWRKGMWLLVGAGFAAGFAAARLMERVLEADGPSVSRSPRQIHLDMNEAQYPPFYCDGLEGIKLEGEHPIDHDEVAIIGVNWDEWQRLIAADGARFALARCDSSSLWHPAVAARNTVLGRVIAGDYHYAAVAVKVEHGTLHLLIGVELQEQFTAGKSSKILGFTNKDGILYDYPDVPLVNMRP